MSLIAWTDLAKSTLAGQQTAFMGGYSEAPAQWPLIAQKINSTMKTETYPWLADTQGAKEWEAERLPGGAIENYLSLTNKDYEVSWKVDRDALRYEKYGQIAMLARGKGRQLARYIDQLVLTLIANAPTTLVYTGAGDTYVADDAHTEGNSGTQDNLSVGGALADATLSTCRAAMMNFKDAAGNPIGLIGDTLVVPPALEATALRLVNSLGVVGSAYNDDNVHKGVYKVIVNPWMTDTNDWALLCTTGIVKPIIWQEFQGPSPVTMIEDRLLTKKYAIFGSDMTGAAAFTDWRYIIYNTV